MVKAVLIALVVMGSIVTVPLVGVYILLNNSGCPPTLMLSVVDEDSYYVQNGLVINVTDSDLEAVSILKTAIEDLLNNPNSLYTQGLTMSEVNSLQNFVETLSGQSVSYPVIFLYNENYIDFGIAYC